MIQLPWYDRGSTTVTTTVAYDYDIVGFFVFTEHKSSHSKLITANG